MPPPRNTPCVPPLYRKGQNGYYSSASTIYVTIYFTQPVRDIQVLISGKSAMLYGVSGADSFSQVTVYRKVGNAGSETQQGPVELSVTYTDTEFVVVGPTIVGTTDGSSATIGK